MSFFDNMSDGARLFNAYGDWSGDYENAKGIDDAFRESRVEEARKVQEEKERTFEGYVGLHAPEELRAYGAMQRIRAFGEKYEGMDWRARDTGGFDLENASLDKDREVFEGYMRGVEESGLKAFPTVNYWFNKDALDREAAEKGRLNSHWRGMMTGDVMAVTGRQKELVDGFMPGEANQEKRRKYLERYVLQDFLTEYCGMDEDAVRGDFNDLARVLALKLNDEHGMDVDVDDPAHGLYEYYSGVLKRDAELEGMLGDRAQEAFVAGAQGVPMDEVFAKQKEVFGKEWGQVQAQVHGEYLAGKRMAGQLEREAGTVFEGLDALRSMYAENGVADYVRVTMSVFSPQVTMAGRVPSTEDVDVRFDAVDRAAEVLMGLDDDQRFALYQMYRAQCKDGADDGFFGRLYEALNTGMYDVTRGIAATADLGFMGGDDGGYFRKRLAYTAEMLNFLQGERPLGRGYGTFVGGLFDAVRSVPIMGMSMVPGGSLMGVVAYGGGNFADNVGSNPEGGTTGIAVGSYLAGGGEAALDRLGGFFMARTAGLLQGAGRGMVGARVADWLGENVFRKAWGNLPKGAALRMVAGGAEAAAKSFGEEYVTENLQDVLDPIAQNVFAGGRPQDLGEFFRQWASWESQSRLMAAIFPFSAVAGGGRMAVSRASLYRLSRYEGVLEQAGATDRELRAMRLLPSQELRDVRAYELGMKYDVAGRYAREVLEMGRGNVVYEGWGEGTEGFVEGLVKEMEEAGVPEVGTGVPEEVERDVFAKEIFGRPGLQGEILQRAADLRALGMPVIDAVERDGGDVGYRVRGEDGQVTVYDSPREASEAVLQELESLEEVAYMEAGRLMREMDADEVGGVREDATKAVVGHLRDYALRVGNGSMRKMEQAAPSVEMVLSGVLNEREKVEARYRIWADEESTYAADDPKRAKVMAVSMGKVLRDGTYGGMLRFWDGATPKEVFEAGVADHVRGLVEMGRIGMDMLEDNLKALEQATGDRWVEVYEEGDEHARLNALSMSMGKTGWAYALGKIADRYMPDLLRRWVRRFILLFASDARIARDLDRARALVDPEVRARLDGRFMVLMDRLIGVDERTRSRMESERAALELVADAVGDGGVKLTEWVAGRLPHPDTLKAMRHPLAAMAQEVMRAQENRGMEGRGVFASPGEKADILSLVRDARKAGFEVRSAKDFFRAVREGLEYGSSDRVAVDRVREEAAGYGAVPARRIDSFADLERVIPKEHMGEENAMVHPITGRVGYISRKSISKMRSERAITKTVVNFTGRSDLGAPEALRAKRVHVAAVGTVDALWLNSTLDYSHADSHGSDHVSQVSRYKSRMFYDGAVYNVKLTVKEYVEEGKKDKIYSVEVESVERVPSGKSETETSSEESVSDTSQSPDNTTGLYPYDSGQSPHTITIGADVIDANKGGGVKGKDLESYFDGCEGGPVVGEKRAEAMERVKRELSDVYGGEGDAEVPYVQEGDGGGFDLLPQKFARWVTQYGERLGDAEAVARALESGRPLSMLLLEQYRDGMAAWNPVGQVVGSPVDAFAAVAVLRNPFQESLKVLVLDDEGRVVHASILTVGSLNESMAPPGLFLKALWEAQPGGDLVHRRVVVSHNHPSGDPRPSEADLVMTKRFQRVLKGVGAELVDHVVTNGRKGFSIVQNKSFDVPRELYAEWEQEAVPRDLFAQVQGPEQLRDLGLRIKAEGRVPYAVYVNTKCRVLAMQGLSRDIDVAIGQLGMSGKLGAYGVMIYMPGGVDSVKYGKEFVEGVAPFCRDIGLNLMDYVTEGDNGRMVSLRMEGFLKEDSVHEEVAGDGVREELPGRGYGVGRRGFRSLFDQLQDAIDASDERKAELLKKCQQGLLDEAMKNGFTQDFDYIPGRVKTAAQRHEKARMASLAMDKVVSRVLRAAPVEVRGKVRIDSPMMTKPEVRDGDGNVVEKAEWVPSLRQQLLRARTGEDRVKVMARILKALNYALEDAGKEHGAGWIKKYLVWAQPKTGRASVNRGKLTLETQKKMDAVRNMVNLPENEVQAGLEQCDSIIDNAADVTAPSVREAVERKAMLEVFGGIFNKKVKGIRKDGVAILSGYLASSLRFEQALTAVHDLYTNGRMLRKEMEGERSDGLKEERKALVNALGYEGGLHVSDQATSQHKPYMGATGWITSKARGYLSFEQFLNDVFGEEHSVVQGHVELLRKARNGYERMRRQRERDFFAGAAQALAESDKQANEWSLPNRYNTGVAGERAIKKILADMEEPTDKWGVDVVAQGTMMEIALSYSDAEYFHALYLSNPQKAMEEGPGWMKDGDVRRQLADVVKQRLEMMKDDLQMERAKYEVKLFKFVPGESVKPLVISDMQAVYMLQATRQERYEDNWALLGITADVVAKVRERVDPRALRLGEWFSKQYEEEYGRISEVYERLFWIPMPKENNYCPMAFWTMGGRDQVADPMERTGSADLGSVGAIKMRRDHKAVPILESAMRMYFSHFSMMDHWIHYAETLRDFKSVFLAPEVREAVQGKYGTLAVEQLDMWVKAIEGDGARDASGKLAMGAFARRFLSARAQGGMAFAYKTLIRQMPAMVSSWAELPAGEALRATRDILTQPGLYAQIWGTETIQHRIIEGMSPEMRMAMERTAISPNRFVSAIRAGMLPIGLTDAAFTTFSAVVAYKAHYDRAVKNGMSAQEAEGYALDRMDGVVKKTAQPVDVEYKSLEEVYGGVFKKTYLQFLSDPRKQAAISYMAFRAAMKMGVRNDVEAWKVRGKAGWKFLNAWVMYGLLNQLAADVIQGIFGLQDDEENVFEGSDYLLAGLFGASEGIFIVGELAKKAVEKALDRDVFNFDNSFMTVLARMGGASSKLYDIVVHGEGDYDSVRDVVKLVDTIGRGINSSGVLASVAPELSAAFQILPRFAKDTFQISENIGRFMFDGIERDREERRAVALFKKEDKEAHEAEQRIKDEVFDLIRGIEDKKARREVYDRYGFKLDDRMAMERRYKGQDMPESVRYLKSLPRDKRKVRVAMLEEKMTDAQRLEFRARLREYGVYI